MEGMVPQQIKFKYFTPTVIVISLIALNGIVFLALRFILGIEAVSNLTQQYPWGIWNAVNKAGGIALAAGGFTTAALSHVMNREHYHIVVRPALLAAALGYSFAAFAVFFDIGRWYYIWHPMIMWNANSALFEVGICVMIYLTVLYIEFLPIVTERFVGKVNLPGMLSKLNNFVDKTLRFLERTLSKTMFIFFIAGVVLSTLHQSSLGTLMVIAGDKMHPLWQTPILPLLFLLSAIAVGFPVVIFESLISARSFKLQPQMKVLRRLGSLVSPILFIYLAFKMGDMVIRESFVYLTEFNLQSVMFMIEIVVGIAIPLRMFLSKSVLNSPLWLFIASSLVIFGVLINRFNNFIIAYHPPYADHLYFPSFGEVSISIGLICVFILLFRAGVMLFPIISLPDENPSHSHSKH